MKTLYQMTELLDHTLTECGKRMVRQPLPETVSQEVQPKYGTKPQLQ